MYIRVIFTKRRRFNLLAWLIRLTLGTKYSHVALEVFDGKTLHLYEASAFGVVKIAQSFFSEKHKVIYSKTIETNEYKTSKAINFCEEYLGAPYGYLTIFGLFLNLVFNIKTKLGVDGNKSVICSELVAKVLTLVDIARFNIKLDYADPKKLYAVIRSIT